MSYNLILQSHNENLNELIDIANTLPDKGTELNFKVVGSTSIPPSVSRNLIPYPYLHTTQTVNGITFTDNGDGSITVNGTATAAAVFRLSHTGVSNNEITLSSGTYHMSGGAQGGNSSTWRWRLAYSYDNWTTATTVSDAGNGATFTLTSTAVVRAYIEISKGATLDNLVFKPQLEKGSTATSYVKYDAGENTIWVNTETPVTSWDFSATKPCRRSANKNLLTYPYYHTTMTTNGITFTDNGDGTITAHGTATAEARFRPFHTTVDSGMIWLEPGTYAVSGCPNGGSTSTYWWQVYDNDNVKTLFNDTGKGGNFTLTVGTHVRGSIIIKSGVTLSGAVFRPQIEKGSTATSFVKGDATGQVWFETNVPSSLAFNTLKKNNIMVYPRNAKQYINDTWQKQDTFVYQAKEWKQPQYIVVPDINRVWLNTSASVNSIESSTVITLTVKSSADGKKATAESYTEIDLTGYDTLYIKCIHSANNKTGSDQNWYLRLYDTSGTNVSSIFTRGDITANTNHENKNYEKAVDISSLSGVYHLKTYAETWANTATDHIITITDIYMY